MLFSRCLFTLVTSAVFATYRCSRFVFFLRVHLLGTYIGCALVYCVGVALFVAFFGRFIILAFLLCLLLFFCVGLVGCCGFLAVVLVFPACSWYPGRHLSHPRCPCLLSIHLCFCCRPTCSWRDFDLSCFGLCAPIGGSLASFS